MVPWSPLLVALGAAWVIAHPWTYAVLGLVRPRGGRHFATPAAVWSAALLGPCLVLLIARPWLVLLAPIGLVLLTLHARFARNGDERSLANDVLLIGECAALIPLMDLVARVPAGGSWTDAWPLPLEVRLTTIVCGAVLLGSTLHVKSLIRERRNQRYARASRWYAGACVLLSMALAAAWPTSSGYLLVVPFTAAAVRAWVPMTGLRPGRIGAVEAVLFAVTAGCVWGA